MKRKLISASLAFAATALVLASCSNDTALEPSGNNNSGRAVEFRTLTSKGTRAAVTNEDNISNFVVTGVIKGENDSEEGWLFNATNVFLQISDNGSTLPSAIGPKTRPWISTPTARLPAEA